MANKLSQSPEIMPETRLVNNNHGTIMGGYDTYGVIMVFKVLPIILSMAFHILFSLNIKGLLTLLIYEK